MAEHNLQRLKQALQTPEKQQTQNGFYPFYLMNEGEKCVIRFLPDKDQSNVMFLLKTHYHSIRTADGYKRLPCLTNYHESCPVCEISKEYYRNKDRQLGKMFYRKTAYLGQVIVVQDPLPATEGKNHQGEFRFISLSPQVFTVIKDTIMNDELEYIPSDFNKGYDFVIKKSKQGEFNNYAIGTKFTKQRALNEHEKQLANHHMVELKSIQYPRMSEQEMMAICDAAVL